MTKIKWLKKIIHSWFHASNLWRINYWKTREHLLDWRSSWFNMRKY